MQMIIECRGDDAVKENFWESFLPFHPAGPGNLTQVTGHSGKHLHPATSNPAPCFLK